MSMSAALFGWRMRRRVVTPRHPAATERTIRTIRFSPLSQTDSQRYQQYAATSLLHFTPALFRSRDVLIHTERRA